MRGSFPIITCDSEDGCDQWTLDWYRALASNWKELMALGWRYDPYHPDRPQLCPDHAGCPVAGWARPEHYDELRDRPCLGTTRYNIGDMDAACDTCGGRTGWKAAGPILPEPSDPAATSAPSPEEAP